MAWDFHREERSFEQIPAGDHRVRIDSVEKAVSKAGNDMLVMKMTVNGFDTKLWNYIVFMDVKPEITNQKLTEVFDSFDIPDGDFNLQHWIGKAGAAHVKIDDQGYSKVAWFIHKKKQANLPQWKVKAESAPAPVPVYPEDLPW